MSQGQMLHGQMSPWRLESVLNVHRNLPLKFHQNRVNNSWDIADIEFLWWVVGGGCAKSFYCQTQPCVEVRLGFWQQQEEPHQNLPKFFSRPNIFSDPKLIFNQRIFLDPNIFSGPTFFPTQHFFWPKIFGAKIFLWFETLFETKFFRDPTFFRPKNLLDL